MPPETSRVQSTTSPAEELLPTGRALGDSGRYRITDYVAIGGMATVYKARDTRLGTDCAIKALFLRNQEDSTEADEFRAEAQLLASIHSPGIVAVRDFFIESGFAFLVMDFIEGDNLYDRHRRTGRPGEDTQDLPISPVPEDQVALYGLSLARALDHLHTRTPAILYRDMKPHNVMRRISDGRVILLDFGIARRMRKRMRHYYSDDLGTPGYAAPEQYESSGLLDARTDIYSLGVVLVELATGYNPRAKGAPRAVPALHTFKASLSPTLAAILQKCVAVNPAERYQSARELIAALESWQKTPRSVRRKSEPQKTWTQETLGPVTGPMLAHRGIVASLDAGGILRTIDASCGRVLAERAGPRRSDGSTPQDMRYRLCPGGPGLIARTAWSEDSGVRFTLYNSKLAPVWRLDLRQARLLTAWTGDNSGLLVAVTGSAPAVACAGPDRKGEWQYTWRSALDAQPVGLASGLDGGAIILDEDATLSAIDSSGAVIWQVVVPSYLQNDPRLLGEYGGIALFCSGSTLAGIDAATGRVLWETPGAGRTLGAPLISGDGSAVYVPTRDAGLTLVRLADGSLEQCGTDFSRPIAGLARLDRDADILALAEYGAGGRVIVFDASRNSAVWSQELGAVGALNAPVFSDDLIVAQEAGGLITAWRWEDFA